MAFSHNIASNKLTLIIVFVAFIASSTLSTSKADLVDDVCDRVIRPTIDADFCKTALRSNPAYAIADLFELTLLAIRITQSYTNSTVSLVTSLRQSANDPKLREIYDSCLRNYETATNELIDCIGPLYQKNYEVLNTRAAAAYDASGVCDSGFREPEAPEPKELQNAAMQVQTLYSTISYMAYKLEGLPMRN